jgi:hypothetical protein
MSTLHKDTCQCPLLFFVNPTSCAVASSRCRPVIHLSAFQEWAQKQSEEEREHAEPWLPHGRLGHTGCPWFDLWKVHLEDDQYSIDQRICAPQKYRFVYICTILLYFAQLFVFLPRLHGE